MKKQLAGALLAAVAIGCSHKTNKTEAATEAPAMSSKEAQFAEKRGDHFVTTLKFDKGQAELNPRTKAELEKAITQARADGKNIDDVTVVVWSDMEYPGTARKLSPHQVKLADKRGSRIEDYLSKDLSVSGYRVSVHNMGTKPNFLQDFFKTADADLKAKLEAEGIAPTAATPMGHASTALIFIKTK